MQCNSSPSHRVDQIVECWSTPLQWLCEVAGYCQELEHAVVYADPEHPKHAQWVTCSDRPILIFYNRYRIQLFAYVPDNRYAEPIFIYCYKLNK